MKRKMEKNNLPIQKKKEGYDFDISPSKEKVIVSTPTQDLKLFNVDGSEKK